MKMLYCVMSKDRETGFTMVESIWATRKKAEKQKDRLKQDLTLGKQNLYHISPCPLSTR